MVEEKLAKLQSYTLLLVEDDEELLHKLHTILGIFFKEVLTALNGHEALDIYKNQKIDMIIADYNMPILNGYEFLKKIREYDKYIPLVIISSDSDKNKLLKSIPLYLTHYLVKPIDYATLTSALIDMVDRIDSVSTSTYNISKTIVYDKIKKELKDDGEIISLSKNEIITLELLLNKKNKIVQVCEIELSLSPTDVKSNQAIKSLMYRLRKKLGKDTITNIAGYGYMLKTQID